jgi:transcriptional regulator with XRE-family HTH domain
MDLKTWREARGLTQSQLARLLGVEVFTISRWERGATKRQAPGRLLELALKEVDRELAAQGGLPT